MDIKDKIKDFYNQEPKYFFKVVYGRLQYNLNIYRRLTIIQGDSGIGKTQFIKILDKYSRTVLNAGEYVKGLRDSDNISVNTNATYKVNPMTREEITRYDVILFDENNILIRNYKLLYDLLKEGYYLVIITRKVYNNFTYPLSEIYSIYTEKDKNGDIFINTLQPNFNSTKNNIDDFNYIGYKNNTGKHMLYIIYGDILWFNKTYNTDYRIIYNINDWFDSRYNYNWLNTAFTKNVIRSIDKSEHIEDDLVRSPFLRSFSITDISGGAKGLITYEYDELDTEEKLIISGENFGDNCTDILVDISNRKDIWINLEHFMYFKPNLKLKAKILNTGIEVETGDELNTAIIETQIEYNKIYS